MDGQLNIEEITEQTQLFQSIAIILLVLAITLLIASIVFFIVFKIPHSIRVLTGLGVKREAKRNSLKERDKDKAKISWSTSNLMKKTEENDNATTVLNSEETVVLSNIDATTVTSNRFSFISDEHDIKITNSNQNISSG